MEFRQLAEARGLAVSNYTGYSDFAHPDPEVRKREIAAMLKNLDVTRELGAPSVRALTGQRWPGVDQEDGIQWVIEGIRRVAEEADRMGLRLNVENHTKAATWTHFDFAMQGEVFLRIMEGLREVPVGVQFDVANPLVAGEDTLALYEHLRTRIGYVHINDVGRVGTFEFLIFSDLEQVSPPSAKRSQGCMNKVIPAGSASKRPVAPAGRASSRHANIPGELFRHPSNPLEKSFRPAERGLSSP